MQDRAESEWSTSAVVVPAISAPSTVACLRSLSPRGVRTIVVSDRAGPATKSIHCDEVITVTHPEEDVQSYVDSLQTLALRPDVSTIIPVREEDVFVLSKHRDRFSDVIATPWPEIETLGRVQDRKRLFELAESLGVATPETRLLDSDIDPTTAWVIKSRYAALHGHYSDTFSTDRCISPPSTYYINRGERPPRSEFVETMGHVPIAQEYIPTTDEYGFFALYDQGEAVATFQHKQIRGWHFSGGPSAYRRSMYDPKLEEAGRTILDGLNWHGLAMVEFLYDDRSEQYKLMEINPRFWSSLPFSVQAGADFPYYYWLLATDRVDEIGGTYRVGMAGHLLRGELLHLHSIVADENELVRKPPLTGTTYEILTSLARHPRFDYLRIDDPKPFLTDALETFEAYRRK